MWGNVVRVNNSERMCYDGERSLSYPVDLKIQKSTGTSCQIEMHFSVQIINFLIKYNLLCF